MATNNTINANSTTPLPIVHGGTGVTSVTISPTATAFAGWDANSNLSNNNNILGYTTTVSSITAIVLTVGSSYQQYITGSSNQTVTMPVTSTLANVTTLAQSFLIVNNSSGITTVNSSGGNLIETLPAGSQAVFTCISNSGTTAASWSSDFVLNVAGVASITGTANQVIASASTGAVTLSLPQSIATTSAVQFNSVRFNTTNAMLDANGVVFASIQSTASAVNYLQFGNNVTANSPTVAALGSDTNIALQLNGKGTGGVVEQGATNGSGIATGYKGEKLTVNVPSASAVNFTSSNAAKDCTSLNLTAGNWMVFGNMTIQESTANITFGTAWLSLSSATLPDASLRSGTSLAGTTFLGLTCPFLLVSVSSTTAVYLSGFCTYTVNTATMCGTITAIRI